MEREAAQVARLRVAAAVVGGVYVLLLAWLAIAAFAPEVRLLVGPWLAWLSEPGSAGAMTTVLSVSAGGFLLFVAVRPQDAVRAPFLASAWCAATAAPLALAAYLPCSDDGPPLWDAVTATLALFLGNFERPFGEGEACVYAVPLGLQVARLTAIVATLSGVTSVIFAVSRSQLDRLALLRARRLTVVVGVDEASWGLVEALARKHEGRDRLVLLTSHPDPAYLERARVARVLVTPTDVDDPRALRALSLWPKVTRVYLLAADATTNRARANTVREVLAPSAGASGTPSAGPRRRLTVIARVDDPWHADEWRKRYIGDPHFTFDAVGIYEETAGTLIRRIRETPGIDQVIVVGDSPLTLALCAELSQLGREMQFVDGVDSLPQVTVLDTRAREVIEDHRSRQQRFVFDPLRLTAVEAEPELEPLKALVGRLQAAGATQQSLAVIVVGGATRLGTRFSVRYPELLTFELSPPSDAPLPADAVVGSLVPFSLSLTDPAGKSADAWERAARAVHERYATRFPDSPRAVSWEELPEFYRESNRRQVITALDSVTALGRSWRPASPEDVPFDAARITSDDSRDRIEEGMRLFDLTEAELRTLAEAEHASWLGHYRADGWSYGATRDDRGKTHPDLREWTALDGPAQHKTMAGVIDTLFQLRALGYRSVRV